MGRQIRRLFPRLVMGIGVWAAVWPAQWCLAQREHLILPSHWGRHGGTPLSYAIEAQAQLVAAQGDFLESVAIARKIHAEAYALEIQNSVEEVKAYFERRRINRAAVLEEKGNRPDYIRKKKREAAENFMKKDLDELFNLADVSKQLNWLFRRLCGPDMMMQYQTGSEALPQLGERLSEEAKAQIWLTDGGSGGGLQFRLSDGRGLDTAWPPGLRREPLDAARTEFESARDELVKEIEANGRVTEPTRNRLILATNELLVMLENVFQDRQEPSVFQEYNAAKKYLRSLVSQVNRAVSTNDRSAFTGAFRFQGNTILELIQHMHQSGLLFAPSKPGGEPAYRNLLTTLRNLYMTFPSARPEPSGDGAEKGEKK
jgi:hypothetical protein